MNFQDKVFNPSTWILVTALEHRTILGAFFMFGQSQYLMQKHQQNTKMVNYIQLNLNLFLFMLSQCTIQKNIVLWISFQVSKKDYFLFGWVARRTRLCHCAARTHLLIIQL